MKQILTLILLIGFIAFANCQIKKTKTVSLNEISKRNIVLKDTIKPAKPLLVESNIIADSLIPTGKFKPFKTNAHASYYADKFTGRKSASGKIFDNNKYMAAHKTLPFGTKLKVTNPLNGKFVLVEIVDRGPFVKGRELDLSKRAFMELSNKKGAGAVIVTIEQLQK
jgi:rare lipoprotein A